MANENAANDNVPVATDISGDGPWKDAPRDQVQREFKAFRENNPFPERFLGVAHHVKPPRDRACEVIDVFSVRVKERDDQLAPCNICHNQSKWFSDGRLIQDDHGWLYFVGPDCAHDYFSGGVFTLWDRTYRQRQSAEQATNYLLQKIPTIPSYLEVAAALLPIAHEVQEAHRQLRNECPVFVRTLRAALKEDGLAVDDVQMVNRANGTTYPRRFSRRVASFNGRPAIGPTCDVVGILEGGTTLLSAMQCANDDELIERLAAVETDGKFARARHDFDLGVQRIAKARDDIIRHRTFYVENNFRSLATWNADKDGPNRFEFECRGTRRSIHERGGGRFWMTFDKLFQPLPELPV